jgi:hypothetical protein
LEKYTSYLKFPIFEKFEKFEFDVVTSILIFLKRAAVNNEVVY